MNNSNYYEKKYLKYKYKYFQAKQLTIGQMLEEMRLTEAQCQAHSEPAKEEYTIIKVNDRAPCNDGGLVELKADKIYLLSGIISCIGIIVRTVTPAHGDFIWNKTGYTIHLTHGSIPSASHFGDDGLYPRGVRVIDKLNAFIDQNKDKDILIEFIVSTLQADFLNNRIKEIPARFMDVSNRRTKIEPTKKVLNKLVETFNKTKPDIIIDYIYGKGQYKFSPEVFSEV